VTPLNVPEARAILRADEALDATFEARQEAGLTFGLEEADAWRKLVASANARIAAWGRGTGGVKLPAVSVLACREGSFWVMQAIEEDVASQGTTLLDALADLGRMFDVRDQLLADDSSIAPNPRAPVEYEQAFVGGHRIGDLPFGRARVAQVSFGISPLDRMTTA
jgi:predicted RNase H-like HicB family nuclease